MNFGGQSDPYVAEKHVQSLSLLHSSPCFCLTSQGSRVRCDFKSDDMYIHLGKLHSDFYFILLFFPPDRPSIA